MSTTSTAFEKEGGWWVRVTVANQEQHDSGPIDFGASYTDGTLDEVINSFLAAREQIPPQYREQARCEISSVGGYEDSHYANVEISYDRPATEEEIAAAQALRREKALAQEAKDRAAYEALRRKFEPLPTPPQE